MNTAKNSADRKENLRLLIENPELREDLSRIGLAASHLDLLDRIAAGDVRLTRSA